MRFSTLLLVALLMFPSLSRMAEAESDASQIKLVPRKQVELMPDTGIYRTVEQSESWTPSQTAVIVCDMWDAHHCLNAVRREQEFAPRLNQLLTVLRKQGVTIIHAPSGCMEAYADHPARQRALDTPRAKNLPDKIGEWCYRIPAEEQAEYPIDQSDGGEDDDLFEHAEWAARLTAMGRNPKAPWQKQIDTIAIDRDRDLISDDGEEIWSVLEAKGIDNVILTGVHTNMCVLGRPFGLRQLAKNGRNVVLIRDLTDTMYNPAMKPFISHFSGTDLIISHIERHVCPTISSEQILGGQPFRYSGDKRPHLVALIAEAEYETEQTLPRFCEEYLRKDFRITLLHASPDDPNDIPGFAQIEDADVLLISVRRRTLPIEQLAAVRRHVAAGKGTVGIRTASHAFSLRDDKVPAGHADWPRFDQEVWGGNYHNHHGNKLKSTVTIVEDKQEHPLMQGVPQESFPQGWSLYKVSPLEPGATVLMMASLDEESDATDEPVAWTFTRDNGGWSFYTSLGSTADFEQPAFTTLLKNAIHRAARAMPAAN